MVVLVTSGSDASTHVALELNLAINFGKKILPLRLELIEPTGPMKYFLGLSQWMDALPPLAPRMPEILSRVRELLREGRASYESRSTRRGPASSHTQLLTQRDALLLGYTYADLIVVRTSANITDQERSAWLSNLEQRTRLLSKRLRLTLDSRPFRSNLLEADRADLAGRIRRVVERIQVQLDSIHDRRAATALGLAFRIGVSRLYVDDLPAEQRSAAVDEWELLSHDVELPAEPFNELSVRLVEGQHAVDSVSKFEEQSLLFLEDRLIYEAYFAQYRANTWKMGCKVGVAASGYAEGAPKENVDNLLLDAESYAQRLDVRIPSLPQLTGSRASDSASVLHYLLVTLGRDFVEEMNILFGRRTSALFEATVKSSILLMLYGEDYEEGGLVTTAIDVVERSLGKAAIPAELWSELVTGARAHEDFEILKDRVFRLHREVGDYLSGIAIGSRQARSVP